MKIQHKNHYIYILFTVILLCLLTLGSTVSGERLQGIYLTKYDAGLDVKEPAQKNVQSLALESSGSYPVALEWKYGYFGTHIGDKGMATLDINGDGDLEIILCTWYFWYIVKQIGTDLYDQVWVSDYYAGGISRIAAADVNSDGIAEIFLGMSDGNIIIYDGHTLEETGSFTTTQSTFKSLVVEDVDRDGTQEIISSDGSIIYVYSTFTNELEWVSSSWGGDDLAVGNVDSDLAIEIITSTSGSSSHGYVVDGITHALQWDNESFGTTIELGDIDSDGISEIIGGYLPSGKISVFDVDSKSLLWEIPFGYAVDALKVADTDGDGVPEILFGLSQRDAIHCYDAVTKSEKWNIVNPSYGVTEIGLGDINNDGVLEVFWGAGASTTAADYLYIADTQTKEIEWESAHIDPPLNVVDVGDVDDDGEDEIVMVSYRSLSNYGDGVIHIFDASTHALEWRSTDLPDLQTWEGVNGVKIADVDNDGQTEIILAASDLYYGVIQVYNGQTHELEGQSERYNRELISALAIGDVDNDGQIEIVGGQKNLTVFDGASVAPEWQSPALTTDYNTVYDIELANVDQDSNIEIIASVAGVQVVVYDGVTHNLEWSAEVPAVALEIFDVDMDGLEEILVGKSDGSVDVYERSSFNLKATYGLGTGYIYGLLIEDVDHDQMYEWLVCESRQMSIFKGPNRKLIWRKTNMGSSLARYNHIIAKNLDDDPNMEILLGSEILYQFDVAGLYFTSYMPLVTGNYFSCPLMHDEFTDPGSGWPIEDTGDTLYEYLNGEYRINIKSWGLTSAARPGFKANDYTVSVDVRNANQVDGSYGILFGLSDDWSQFYSFEITMDGYYAVWRYDANNGWVELAYGSSSYINQDNISNIIKVERNSSKIKAYANGQLLATVSDSTFTGLRHIGLVVSILNGSNLDVRFDNFTVNSLKCEVGMDAMSEINNDINSFGSEESKTFYLFASRE